MPWGTHFGHTYETRDDLLDTLVPYFKAGLEDNEFCLWVVSEPLTEGEAWKAPGGAAPDLDRYVARRKPRDLPGARLVSARRRSWTPFSMPSTAIAWSAGAGARWSSCAGATSR